MRSFGIMQGRLTPSKGREIQFFPFDFWEEEFYLAAKLGLDEIEYIFDYDNFYNNPIWSEDGIRQLKEVINKTGITVKSVCWDYFMRRSFYKSQEDLTIKVALEKENKEFFIRTIRAMKEIGASLIEIPMVDDSSIRNSAELEEATKFIQWCCDEAEKENILVGLENDFPPVDDPISFRHFLESIDRKNVKANYDSGNSSGIGYDAKEELVSLNEFVYNVHIKDRVKGNGTVELGTGSADFDNVFHSLKDIGYKGSFIMQAARGEDGKEFENIKSQIEFTKRYLEKYGFES